MLRRIFLPNEEKVIGEWRDLNNDLLVTFTHQRILLGV
jgi:hypothetical protein